MVVATLGELEPADALQYVLVNDWQPLVCGCALSSNVTSSGRRCLDIIHITFKGVMCKIVEHGVTFLGCQIG